MDIHTWSLTQAVKPSLGLASIMQIVNQRMDPSPSSATDAAICRVANTALLAGPLLAEQTPNDPYHILNVAACCKQAMCATVICQVTAQHSSSSCKHSACTARLLDDEFDHQLPTFMKDMPHKLLMP